MRNRLVLVLFLFLSLSGIAQKNKLDSLNSVFAQAAKKNDSKTQVRSLIEIADIYEEKGNFSASKKKFLEALKFSGDKKEDTYISDIYNRLAWLHHYHGEYKKAVDYTLKAIETDRKSGNEYGVAYGYYNLATFFFLTENYEKADYYIDQAIAINKNRENKNHLVNNLIMKALILVELGKAEKAIDFIQFPIEFYTEQNDSVQLSMTYSNLGYILDKAEQHTKALEVFYTALSYTNAENDPRGFATISIQLADELLKNKTGEYQKALMHAKNGLEFSLKLNLRSSERDAYEILSKLNAELGNYREAYDYQVLFFRLKEEISGAERKAELEKIESDHQLKTKEKDVKLKQQRIELLEEKNRSGFMRNIGLAGAVVFLLILMLLSYSKRKRDRQLILKEKELESAKKELLRYELEQAEVRNEELESEVAYKNKELHTLAQHIIQKNDVLKNLRNEMKEGNVNQKQFEQMLGVGLDADRMELEERINNIDSLFYKKLKEEFPNLSENDLRLISLTKMNMSSKEIAILMGVNPKSVDMARYRLRKKMNVKKEANLYDFLQAF